MRLVASFSINFMTEIYFNLIKEVITNASDFFVKF